MSKGNDYLLKLKRFNNIFFNLLSNKLSKQDI